MTQNPWNSPPQMPPGGPAQPLNYAGNPTYPEPGVYGVAPKPKGMAVASMVLGICSLAFCILPYVNVCTTPILATLAIVFGILGRNAAKRGEGDGESMATAGLIMGIIALGLIVLAFLLFLLGVGLAGLGASAGSNSGGF